MMRLVGIALLAAGCVGEAPSDIPERSGEDPSQETGAGTGLNDSEITPAQYLEEIAEIQCEQAFGCRDTYPGEPTAFEATWSTSIGECTAKWFAAWNPGGLESEIAKGRVKFDGKAAVACLGGVAFGSCSEHWERGIQWGEPCYHVMKGDVPIGGSCDVGYACTSGTCDATTHRCI